jgi:hypothetical protein
MVLYISRLERRTSVVAESACGWRSPVLSLPSRSLRANRGRLGHSRITADIISMNLIAAIPRPQLLRLPMMSCEFCWRISRDPPPQRCRRDFSCSSPATRTAGNSGRGTSSFDSSSRSLRACIVCKAYGSIQVEGPDTGDRRSDSVHRPRSHTFVSC